MSQKTLLFDMGNVLLRFNPKELLMKFTQDPAQQERIHQALFTTLWYELDLGRRSTQAILADVYQQVCRDDQQVLEAFMSSWFKHMSVLPNMEELIQSLSHLNYRMILCSNASLQFFDYQSDFNVLKYFEAYVISAQIKEVKPNSAYFQYVLDTHHLTAQECIFIDDLARNIAGAQAMGFITYHFKEDAEALKQFILSQ